VFVSDPAPRVVFGVTSHLSVSLLVKPFPLCQIAKEDTTQQLSATVVTEAVISATVPFAPLLASGWADCFTPV